MSFRLEKATELMDEAEAKGRLGHAYLITGPEGSGKERLAVHLVQRAHPDRSLPDELESLRSNSTSVIGPESKSRIIKVDAIRDLEHTLQMAVPEGVTKFAIVRDADRMGPQAENAFLKTLEEPPKGSRLLLLTARPEVLLETILSRCIRIPLTGPAGPVDIGDSAGRFLEELRQHVMQGRSGVSGALGLMASFSTILRDEKAEIAKRHEEALKAEVKHYQKTTEGDYLKRREEYYKAMTEAEYLRRRNLLIDYLMMWFGDAMRQRHGGERLDLPDYAEATGRLAREDSLDRLGRKVEAVEKLRDHLNTNIFEALALEVGFIRAFS